MTDHTTPGEPLGRQSGSVEPDFARVAVAQRVADAVAAPDRTRDRLSDRCTREVVAQRGVADLATGASALA